MWSTSTLISEYLQLCSCARLCSLGRIVVWNTWSLHIITWSNVGCFIQLADLLISNNILFFCLKKKHIITVIFLFCLVCVCVCLSLCVLLCMSLWFNNSVHFTYAWFALFSIFILISFNILNLTFKIHGQFCHKHLTYLLSFYLYIKSIIPKINGQFIHC